MQVDLLSSTTFHYKAVELITGWSPDLGTTAADALAEFAGRSCYQSWDRPNPKTATNRGYLANILKQQHYSVLEHASASFYLTGISRSETHENIRHRHFSFSQWSQRFIVPGVTIDWIRPPDDTDEEWVVAVESGRVALAAYHKRIEMKEARKVTGKIAREAARAVLPNMTPTSLVVSGNHRAWREFLENRATLGADAEIRAVAMAAYQELVQLAPNTYQDFQVAGTGSYQTGGLYLTRAA